MFVLKSTYDKVCRKATRAELDLSTSMLKQCMLESQVEYLLKALEWAKNNVPKAPPQKMSDFNKEDVQRLLMLCHPDKHDGKPMATEMTAKLLKLKETLK